MCCLVRGRDAALVWREGGWITIIFLSLSYIVGDVRVEVDEGGAVAVIEGPVVGRCLGGWEDIGWRDEWKTGVYAVQYERQTALLEGERRRRRRLGS